MDSHEHQFPVASETPRQATTRVRRPATWAGLAAAVVATGTLWGVPAATTSAAAAPAVSGTRWPDTGWPGTSGTSGTSRTDWRGGWGGGWNGGWGGFGGSDGATSGDGATVEATAAQQAGVVDIDVVLGGTQQAAGTGMVLTPSGEVLTNRHVVLGETSLAVTVPATGRTYAARVVGTRTATDVAVVQLVGASGLATVTPASDAVQVGDAVVGVGNAGGTGGTPTAATGTVTGVDQTITASDTDGGNPEQLAGLIETDAPIQPGDSGGPLLDTSDTVVGMDTAGSARGNDGYAIPIATALAAARQIEAGGSDTQAGAGTTTQTQRGYLGVEVQDGASGALVGGVVEGSPAAAAGLEAGDTITSVAGHRVGGVDDLASAMSSGSPGQQMTVTWTDPQGTTHSARVTLSAAQS